MSLMPVAGVDLGAVSASVVIMSGENDVSYRVFRAGGEGEAAARFALEEALKATRFAFTDLKNIVATGCGRRSVTFAGKLSTEIVCQARGARHLLPSARTVVNLGAESSLVIGISETGKAESFAKNDKCASGSGLFLETISIILGIPVEEMGELSMKAERAEEVSSICAVFAESEVISHIHRGIPRDHILAGVHSSVAGKIIETLGKISLKNDMIATGGVAKNAAVIRELESKTGFRLAVPPEPQIAGALGAALVARE